MLQALGAAEAGEKVPWKMCCSWQPSKGCCGRMSEGGQSYELPGHWDFCTDHTLQSRLERLPTLHRPKALAGSTNCRDHADIFMWPLPLLLLVPQCLSLTSTADLTSSDTGFNRSQAHASGLRIRKLHRLGWAADVRFPVQSASWRRWKYCA